MAVRVLIVDDEPIAREGVRLALARHPGYEIVGECANGMEAVVAIREHAPDLVFLDIQMPDLDGFGVVEAIGAAHMPIVLFVTAHDAFALKAFDVSAVDYLLKPFGDDRFDKALTRASLLLERRGVSEISRQLESLTRILGSADRPLDRIVVRTTGRIFFLNVSEIYWIRSADNYLELHLKRETHLIRETLGRLAAKLDPAEFIRIRASTIVNVRHVTELRTGSNGEYAVALENGTTLMSSRRYRTRLAPLLGL